MTEKSGGRIRGAQWWWSVGAFLAGMAVHALGTPPQPQALAAGPSAIVTTLAPDGGDASLAPVMANADRDVSDIQLD